MGGLHPSLPAIWIGGVTGEEERLGVGVIRAEDGATLAVSVLGLAKPAQRRLGYGGACLLVQDETHPPEDTRYRRQRFVDAAPPQWTEGGDEGVLHMQHRVHHMMPLQRELQRKVEFGANLRDTAQELVCAREPKQNDSCT